MSQNTRSALLKTRVFAPLATAFALLFIMDGSAHFRDALHGNSKAIAIVIFCLILGVRAFSAATKMRIAGATLELVEALTEKFGENVIDGEIVDKKPVR